jgi:signal transduction histidine kinase
MLEIKIQEIGVMFATSVGTGFKYFDFTAINKSVEEIVKNPNLVYIGIFDQENKMVSFYNPNGLKLDFKSMVHNKNVSLQKEISFFSTEINFENISYGNLVIGYSLVEMHQQIHSNMVQGLLICFLILTLGTLLIMIQSQALTRNIMMLKEAAKKFDWGKKHSPISIKSNDEVGDLCSAFNTLIDEVNTGIVDIEKKSHDLEKKNQELGDFINIASHDFNEPLNDIANIRNLMQTSLSKSESKIFHQESTRYLDIMQKPIKRSRQLISDLLKYSSIIAETGYRGPPIELKAVVQKAMIELDFQIKKADGKIKVGSLPEIEAHPFQIQQVFINLIGNALKFRKKEEPPLISIQSENYKYTDGRPGFVISIEDNGLGFDQKNVEKVFMPLFRLVRNSEREGSGMGLTICKRIIEHHDGTIHIESSLGKGTTFFITLPANRS